MDSHRVTTLNERIERRWSVGQRLFVVALLVLVPAHGAPSRAAQAADGAQRADPAPAPGTARKGPESEAPSGNVTHWTVGDVRLEMRTNPSGSADFHAVFQQTQQSLEWARANARCSYLALALRARDDAGFPAFSVDLVCPALPQAPAGASIDCDGFLYRAPRVDQTTPFDLNLVGRACP